MSKVSGWFDISIATKHIDSHKAQALHRAAERLMQASQEQVPYDTGRLRDSAAITVEGDGASVSYDTPYAAIVHERPANYQHGRKNKYLEDPMNDSSVQRDMADALAEELKL